MIILQPSLLQEQHSTKHVERKHWPSPHLPKPIPLTDHLVIISPIPTGCIMSSGTGHIQSTHNDVLHLLR